MSPLHRSRRRRPITVAEEREAVIAIFGASFVVLAMFLGFVGVLAAVQPSVERISYLRVAFAAPVWMSLIGVVLSGSVCVLALAYLSGRAITARWIILPMYWLITVVVVAAMSLVWAIGL